MERKRSQLSELQRDALRQQREKWERLFAFHWRLLGTGLDLDEQFVLVDGRRWRFDFASQRSCVGPIEDSPTVLRKRKSLHLTSGAFDCESLRE